MRNAILRTLGVLGLSWLAIGCGGQDQWKEAAENVKRANDFQDKKMKGIADDKSLKDPEAFKKYLDSLPEVQTSLPKEVAPWWSYKPVDGGQQIFIRDVILSQWEEEAPEVHYQRERDFIRNRMLMCRRMLTDLKDRKLQQVTLTLFTKQTEKGDHVEVFRSVMTTADLVHLENPPAKAEAGGIFDPRGSKIGTVCKVELNRFPELQYTKRAK